MKKCYRCNYSEEDDSSLFCSNCGNSFETGFRNFSNHELKEVSMNKNKKIKILVYFDILGLIITISLVIIHAPFFIFLLTILVTIIIAFLLLHQRFSYDFEQDKGSDKSDNKIVKIGIISSFKD